MTNTFTVRTDIQCFRCTAVIVIHIHAAAAAKSLSRVQLFVTPWTVAYQAPQSMEFSKQDYWSGFISFSDLQYSTRIYIQYAVITYYQKESEKIDMYMCGEGNGTPLQYSCLENPKDGGAW